MSRVVDSPAPLFVLRGHRAAIHTITITSRHRRHTNHANEAKSRPIASLRSPSADGRLYSGDATGVVMVWDLSTRRSIARFHAHNTAPILAIHEIGDGKIITQGKDGFVRIWTLTLTRATDTTDPATGGTLTATQIGEIQTGAFTFLKSQIIELNQPGMANEEVTNMPTAPSTAPTDAGATPALTFPTRPILLLPCEEASCIGLYDLSHSLSAPLQLIELEVRIPRDPDFEDRIRDRLSPSEIDELEHLLAQQPPQYERKVGMAMAAKFFLPDIDTDSTAHIRLEDLRVCWASESGIMGVWDCHAQKQIFKQQLHKETILSFDLNLSGTFGVSTSSVSLFHSFSIDLSHSRLEVTGEVSVPHDGLSEVVLRSDGRIFATAGWDHRSQTTTHRAYHNTARPFTSNPFSSRSDCSRLFPCCVSSVRLFDGSTLSPLAILREHTDTVQCVAMPAVTASSPLFGYIASGAKDGKIAIFRLYAGDEEARITTANGGKLNAMQAHQQIYQQRRQANTQHTPADAPRLM